MRVDIGVGIGVNGEVKKKDEHEGKGDAAAAVAAATEVVLVDGKLRVKAWQTFRGHTWDDKGELKGEGWLGVSDSRASGENDGASWTVNANGISVAAGNSNSTGGGTGGAVVVDVRPVTVLNYYQARSECEFTERRKLLFLSFSFFLRKKAVPFLVPFNERPFGS